MLNFGRIAALSVGDDLRASIAARLRKRGGLAATAVTFEFGRDEASILAAVRQDGRARLTLGSGEEFIGPYGEMPLAVVRGARRLLETAGPWSRSLPGPDQPAREDRSVRVVIETEEDVREIGMSLTELRDPDVTPAPVWEAFTDWFGAFLVVLFGDPPGRSSLDESPALSRARGLCRQVEGNQGIKRDVRR